MSAESPISYNNTTFRSKEAPNFRELIPSFEIIDIQAGTVDRESEIRSKLTVLGHNFPYLLTPSDLKEPIWKGFHTKELQRGR